MIVVRDNRSAVQPPSTPDGPFYVIRYVRRWRDDARKPWTAANTRYCFEQWDEGFDDLKSAQETNQRERLDGQIYRVEAVR